MDMEAIIVSIPVTVTDNDIDDIMCTVLEGGITYWCGRVEVPSKCKGDCDYASEYISCGGTLKIYAEDDCFDLDKDKFLDGLTLWLSKIGYWKRPRYIYITDKAYLRVENIDAIEADQIIQYALFGEIVYS